MWSEWGVGGDYVIELFDGVRLEIIKYFLVVAALARVYQHGVLPVFNENAVALTDIYNMDGERLVECVAALYRLLIAREQFAPCGDIEREIHIGREGYQQRDGYHDCGDD